jgi:hypothetical protein
MAWLDYRLKDGPAQCAGNATCQTGTVHGTTRRPYLLLCRYPRNRSTAAAGMFLYKKVKVKFALEQTMKVQVVSTGIASPFNLGVRWGWWLMPFLASLPSGERPSIHCVGGWVAIGPVWKGAEKLALTGIRSPDQPARSYSGPPCFRYINVN